MARHEITDRKSTPDQNKAPADRETNTTHTDREATVCPADREVAVYPGMVRVQEYDSETSYYVCGECHQPIDPVDRYCRRCGRKVRWDAVSER